MRLDEPKKDQPLLNAEESMSPKPIPPQELKELSGSYSPQIRDGANPNSTIAYTCCNPQPPRSRPRASGRAGAAAPDRDGDRAGLGGHRRGLRGPIGDGPAARRPRHALARRHRHVRPRVLGHSRRGAGDLFRHGVRGVPQTRGQTHAVGRS